MLKHVYTIYSFNFPKQGYSTLSIAVQFNHVEIFLELLKRGLEFCDECVSMKVRNVSKRNISWQPNILFETRSSE